MTKKVLRYAILLFSIVLFVPIKTYSAPNIKSNEYVHDELNVISKDTEELITSTNKEMYSKMEKAQVKVVTIEDLQGEDAFDYSVDLFNSNTIGDEEKDNGVLILLAKDKTQNKDFIEIRIGYGLEGALPDGKTGRIIDSGLKDYDDDYDEALKQMFLSVVNEINKEYDSLMSDETFEDMENKDNDNNLIVLSIVVLVAAFVILGGMTLITGNPIYIDFLLTIFRVILAVTLDGNSSSNSSSNNSSSGGETGGGGAGRSID